MVTKIIYEVRLMKENKNAINISLLMIMLSLLGTILCCLGNKQGIYGDIFSLTTGIFGSSFATLWIFIYEYNREKRELLSCIFMTANEIMESMPMISYKNREIFYAPELKCYLEGKYYLPPTDAKNVEKMEQQEKCLYELCRFVDMIEDIGYKKIDSVCSNVEKIDFWTDSFRRKYKRRDIIRDRISMPFYEVFITAPAMEDGYIFRCISQFKKYYLDSAEDIYPLVVELNNVVNESNDAGKYSWLDKNSNMGCYMHEKLWIFRDAFFERHISRRKQRMAMKAFVVGTEYIWIR